MGWILHYKYLPLSFWRSQLHHPCAFLTKLTDNPDSYFLSLLVLNRVRDMTIEPGECLFINFNLYGFLQRLFPLVELIVPPTEKNLLYNKVASVIVIINHPVSYVIPVSGFYLILDWVINI